REHPGIFARHQRPGDDDGRDQPEQDAPQAFRSGRRDRLGLDNLLLLRLVFLLLLRHRLSLEIRYPSRASGGRESPVAAETGDSRPPLAGLPRRFFTLET